MIAIGHSAMGVIVGEAVIYTISPSLPIALQLLLAFGLALALHYAMDFLPHGHYYVDYKKLDSLAVSKVLLDLMGGILIFLFLAAFKYSISSLSFWTIVAAIAGSQLTDVFEAATKFKLIPRWSWVRVHSTFHKMMHWHNEPDSPLPGGARPFKWTDVWQVAVVAVTLLILLK